MEDVPHQTWLADELPGWVADGVITGEQAAGIQARYAAVGSPQPSADHETPGGRLVGVVASIGAALVGLGIILFVGANWDGMTSATRLVTLISVMVLTAVIGFGVRRSETLPVFSTVVLLISTMTFGASIFLVGQTYNVQAHDPLGFLILAVAAGAMAITLDSRAHGVLASASLVAWWAHESIERIVNSDDDTFVVSLVAIASAPLTLYAAGRAIEVFTDRSPQPWARSIVGPAQITGLYGFAGVLLMPMSFVHHMDDGDILSLRDSTGAGFLGLLLPPILLAVASAIVVASDRVRVHARFEAGIIGASALMLVMLTVIVLPIISSAMVNACIVMLALGCIAGGITRREPGLYSVGVAIAVAEIFLRYVDLAISQEQLSGSIFFIGGGLLLIALAWGINRARVHWKEEVDVA